MSPSPSPLPSLEFWPFQREITPCRVSVTCLSCALQSPQQRAIHAAPLPRKVLYLIQEHLAVSQAGQGESLGVCCLRTAGGGAQRARPAGLTACSAPSMAPVAPNGNSHGEPTHWGRRMAAGRPGFLWFLPSYWTADGSW